MSAYSSVQVKGLEETLREIRKIEPEYVKAFRKQARSYAADAVQAVKKEYDWTKRGWREKNFPLVNMSQGSLIGGRQIDWNASRARRGIKFRLGAPRNFKKKKLRSYRMFSITQADAAGAIYDMAGKRKSNPNKPFEETLEEFVDQPHSTRQQGRPDTGPSRYMWPGAYAYLPVLEDKIRGLIRDLERKTNRILLRKPR